MKTRMHPSIILEYLISSLAFVFIIGYTFLIQMINDFNEDTIKETSTLLSSIGGNALLLGVIVFALVLGAFTIFFYFKWRNTYLYFEKSNLVIERGKIFKKITTIHLSDIASINIKRNILEKILGTSHLKLELNMNTDQNFAGKLVFKEPRALEIKNSILGHMGKEVTEEETFPSIIDYDTKDVFRHMWLSVDINVIIIIAISYCIIIFAALGEMITKAPFFVAISVLIVIVPIIWSLLKNYFSYYGFKVNRDDKTIKLSYGAFTTYKYNLPTHRINAVIIRQTLQARIAKYSEVEVVNAGLGSEEEEKTIISLYSKQKERDLILNEIVPEYQNSIKLLKQPQAALKHYLLAKTPWIILGIYFCFITNYISLIIIPFVIVIAILQYMTNKIGFDGDKIIIQNGIINKNTYIIKFKNIELIEMKKHLLSYLFKTYSLKINVVGPAINSTFVSGLFREKTINGIVNKYLGEPDEN